MERLLCIFEASEEGRAGLAEIPKCSHLCFQTSPRPSPTVHKSFCTMIIKSSSYNLQHESSSSRNLVLLYFLSGFFPFAQEIENKSHTISLHVLCCSSVYFLLGQRLPTRYHFCVRCLTKQLTTSSLSHPASHTCGNEHSLMTPGPTNLSSFHPMSPLHASN